MARKLKPFASGADNRYLRNAAISSSLRPSPMLVRRRMISATNSMELSGAALGWTAPTFDVTVPRSDDLVYAVVSVAFRILETIKHLISLGGFTLLGGCAPKLVPLNCENRMFRPRSGAVTLALPEIDRAGIFQSCR